MTTQLLRPVTRTVPSGPHELVPDGTLGLVLDLCHELWASGVRYCQWKNNFALVRSLRGESDLDLLIHRRDAQRFIRALTRLGFRRALAPGGREQPGVGHYYALDEGSGRLLHVHAHFTLLLGGDTTKNFRLPVERAYLGSVRYEHVLPTPAPEFELAVWVVRMMVKHASWDAWVVGNGRLTPAERRELAWLLRNTDLAVARAVVAEHIPGIEAELWTKCLHSLAEDSTTRRLVLGASVSRRLRPHARRGRAADLTLRVMRRGLRGGRRHLLRKPVRKRLGQTGATVAIFGGDQESRSAAVSMTIGWLGSTLMVRRAQLGEPRPSVMTHLFNGTLVLLHGVGLARHTSKPTDPTTATMSDFPGIVWALGNLITARDRLREYHALRTFADRGGVVVSDHWPLSSDHVVDGPGTAWVLGCEGVGRLTRMIADQERAIYRHIAMPDILVVLPPSTGMPGVAEPGMNASLARARATSAEDVDWKARGATVLDSRATQDSVASAVRAAIWASI